jgi:FkbM family methyltransferase
LKELLKRTFAGFGYRIEGIRYVPRQLLVRDNLRALEFDDVVCRRIFDVHHEFTFIQVGAFDGVVQDPLQKYIERENWRGVLVEPQARAAAKLRKLYHNNDRIKVLQVAVDATSGKRTLFTINSEAAPAWAGALASFHREVILKHSHQISQVEAMIEEEIVDCVTFDSVLDSFRMGKLDLLQIDTEGADGFILSLFPFHRLRPAIVHFEISHLNMKQREECLGRLVGFGYRLAPSGSQDMLAVLS